MTAQEINLNDARPGPGDSCPECPGILDARSACDSCGWCMEVMTCGTCGKSWDDRVECVPSARCPFEYEHETEVKCALCGVKGADRQHTTGPSLVCATCEYAPYPGGHVPFSLRDRLVGVLSCETAVLDPNDAESLADVILAELGGAMASHASDALSPADDPSIPHDPNCIRRASPAAECSCSKTALP